MKPKRFDIPAEAIEGIGKALTEMTEETKAQMRKVGVDMADRLRCPEIRGTRRCEKLRGHPGAHQFEKATKARCEVKVGSRFMQCTKEVGHSGPHM